MSTVSAHPMPDEKQLFNVPTFSSTQQHQHGAHHAKELQLPVAMWSFLFGYLSEEEVEDLREQGAFKHGNLKTNNALWKYLYIEVFNQITPHSQLSVDLRKIEKPQTGESSIEGFFRDEQSVPRDLQEIYQRYASFKVSSNGLIQNTRSKQQQSTQNTAQTSLWFELFQRDWQHFMHVYVDQQTKRVIRFDYPTVPTPPLFTLWVDFDWTFDAEKQKQDMLFGVRLAQRDELTMGDFSTLQNMFRNTGLVVCFEYTPTEEECAQANIEARRISTRFVVDSKGNSLQVRSIDELLNAPNHRKRPPVLDINLSAQPVELRMGNIDFLVRQQMYTHFSIGVFITHRRVAHSERTITFNRNELTNGSLRVFQGKPCDAVLHEINADGSTRGTQFNAESANAVRRLLTVSSSKLQ